MNSTKKVVLEARNITVNYPGTTALDGADFQLLDGEIHAIVGENGAGKSTMVNVFAGIVSPSAGEIRVNDTPKVWKTSKEAIEAGIATIYQEPALFPQLTVAENIFSSNKIVSKMTKRILWKKMHEQADVLLSDLGINRFVRPQMWIDELTIAQKQVVEIAKALSTNAKIVIMDEPTSSLSSAEISNLFQIIRKLKRQGVAIIIISHKPEEILEISDRVSVFRDARYIGTKDTNHVDEMELIKMMVGREISQIYPKQEVQIGKEVLRVKNLSRAGYFRNISFSLHEGEILGLSGLVGAGRTEVAESIFGIAPYEQGNIFVNGKEVHIRKPSDAIRLGMGFVTENRAKDGLFLDFTITDNLCALSFKELSKGFFLDNKKLKSLALKQTKKFDIKANSLDQSAKFLSGGNQQKVVIAKWLTQKKKILIVDEPIKGIDVANKARIHHFISELASQGVAILMISSELIEILGMCDRIVVMAEGELMETFDRKTATQEKIMKAATNTGAKEKL